ncbi:MAG: helix-turn-helix transcriptional regulator [Hymenobacter sp.]
METQNINQRFELLIKQLEPSQSSFAKRLETSTGRLSNIIKGRNKPDSQLLAKIAEEYPEVDINWLLTGKYTHQRNVNLPGVKNQRILSHVDSENTHLHTHLNTHLDTHPYQSSTILTPKSAISEPILNDEERQNNLLNSEDAADRSPRSGFAQEVALVKIKFDKSNQAKQRNAFDKFLHLLEIQHPELASHRQSIGRLFWLIDDAKELIEEHFSLLAPDTLFVLPDQQGLKSQSFEEYQLAAVKGLERTLPFDEAVADLIAAIEQFMQAVPLENDNTEPETAAPAA